ncbi:MAG: hypothetical protein PHS76_06835, partial [Sphaerochaeta sp.]|nr:hypothetical protein [Sphaerochaeta sp.]
MRNKLRFCMVIAMLAIMTLAFAGASAEKQETKLRFIDVSPSPTRQEYFTNTFDKFKQETGITV